MPVEAPFIVGPELGALHPFGDALGTLPLLGRPLSHRRHEEVLASGTQLERWRFAGHAFAAAPLLAHFAAVASGPSRLGLASDHPSHALLDGSSVARGPQGVALDIFFDAETTDLETLRALPVTYLDGGRAPRLRTRAGASVAGAGHVAAHVEHWMHLLWLAPRLVELDLSRLRGRRRRGARRPSWVGKGADIHPRAFLDGAIVGEGAVVGESAAVIDSYLGPKSVLSDLARIRSSVLEAGTHVLTDARFTDVVALGRGSLASVGLRDTLLGRDVFLTSGVIFWSDDGEPVSADTANGRVDTGRRQLGGCAGHGAVLGARTIVAPGRVLPNGATVVMRREEGVQRVEAAPGVPACWDDAALVPVETLSAQ